MASSKSTDRITEYNKSIRKTAGKAQTGKKTANAKAGKKTGTAIKENKKKGMGLTTAITLGLAFAFVLELSNFDILGKFGGWVKYGQFGLFGIMAYIFPFVVFLGFVVSTFEERKGRYVASGLFLFLFICAFAHLVSFPAMTNQGLLSNFTLCAENLTGGGIVGGAIALGLFMLLSHTGSVIICVLIMLVCLFFLMEDLLKNLFAGLFEAGNREEDYPEEEIEEYYEDPLPVPERKTNRSVKKEPVRNRRDESVRGRGEVIKSDGPVYVAEDDEGTVIRIVRTRKKKGRSHEAPIIRSTRKAQPLRDGTTDIVRAENKARGISRELDMDPRHAGGDELHEITKQHKDEERGASVVRKSGRDLFEDTKIVPKKEVLWDDEESPVKEEKKPKRSSSEKDARSETEKRSRKEAAVTSVKEAAVNQRAKEARPVKVYREDVKKPAFAPVHSSGTDETPYNPPPMELLARVKGRSKSSEAELEKIAENLEVILEQFGVHVTVTDIQAGPSVTRFELQPELGTRVNKITSLADDLKLNLGVTEIRIEAPIPGRQAVGIEIPNKNRQTVYMRELLEEPALINHSSKLAFAAGKDISGNVVVADIAKMPHLLVAGTTGSGKSVFLNTILMTILFRAKPSEVGLIIIDPKKVEFGVYQGIPHLMKDVVTDPGQAVSTLRWAVNEMTNRYQRMQMSSVRDFKSYNAKVEKGTVSPEEENPRKMNQIVIIIDELADLMMVAKKEAEALICRLAQLARAAGIHLIIATQRPSVDVVTGLIKANVPARVALLVSSQIDSRTIIDMPGAEKLLGNGDMLFYPTGYVKPVRIQGAFVSDDEIMQTVDYLTRYNESDYFSAESKEIEKFLNSPDAGADSSDGSSSQEGAGKYDECFYEAGKVCIEMGKASSSMLQRRFNLGFNRAARIIDQLEEFGAVGPQNGAKPREILVDTMTFEEMYQEMMNGKK